MGVYVLDPYYLSITAIVTVAYQLFFFAIAFSFKFDKLTDFAGGTNFVVLAILTLGLSGTRVARNIVDSVFMIVWGLRLSGFLLFRILKTGKDDRFDDKRNDFFKFLGFWVFQMFWVWTVSLPVTIINSPSVLQYDQPNFNIESEILGVILWAVGFTIETVADWQKYQFRSKNKDPALFMRTGLFKWSRHPNYFGEMMLHLGIFLIVISPATHYYVHGGGATALGASIVGWVFLVVLLMFVSGLPLQERPGAKKRYEKGLNYDEYKRYLDRTSILFPMPPAVYVKMPKILKRTIFLEFPIYVFDPAKHSDAGPGQSGAEEGGSRAEGSAHPDKTGQHKEVAVDGGHSGTSDEPGRA